MIYTVKFTIYNAKHKRVAVGEFLLDHDGSWLSADQVAVEKLQRVCSTHGEQATASYQILSPNLNARPEGDHNVWRCTAARRKEVSHG